MKSESQILCLPQVFSNHITDDFLKFSGEERFQGGTLVSTYDGIATDGELITMEASGLAPEGHYVLLQKDNEGLAEGDWQLHVADFAAFGEYTAANIAGCPIKSD